MSHHGTLEIDGCYRKFYINRFFYCTSRLWNPFPASCFPVNFVIFVLLYKFWVPNTST